MTLYKVWRPHLENESKALEIECNRSRDAALKYCYINTQLMSTIVTPGSRDVWVRAPDGTIECFVTGVEYITSFYAERVPPPSDVCRSMCCCKPREGET